MLSYISLTLSALMLAGTAWLIARRSSPEPAERFWISIAAIILQLGSISLLLSWFGAFAAGPFLALQSAVLASLALPQVWQATRRWRSAATPPLPALDALPERRIAGCSFRRLARDPISLALLIVIAAFIVLSGAYQWISPLTNFDDRMYHAPRAVYWVQNRSILPFETHNDRHTVFPFAGELSFAWSLLFVKHELPGRMAFWLAFPATAAGIFLLAREMRVPQRFALAAALLYISTPNVLRWSSTLKSDAWQPLLVIGAAYFAARALGSAPAAPRRWAAAGLLFACALAVKTTSLAIAPGIAAAALARLRVQSALRALTFVAAGALLGAVLSGFAFLTWWNIQDHGAPLGPKAMAAIVRPDLSTMQLRAHAARLPVYLLELPELTPQSREWVLSRKTAIARATGADRDLEGETDRGWPGTFRAALGGRARAFSLGGLLWLPLLVVGLIRTVREVRRRWGRHRPIFSRTSVVVLIQVPLLIGVVFGVRWMGGGPDRFWMAPYALAVPMIAYFFALWARRASLPGALAGILLIWAVYPSLRERIILLEGAVTAPVAADALEEPYQLVTPHLAPGDTVLLFASQASRDYPLFGPRRGYTTRIIAWGKRPFDEQALADRLEDERISHVLFEHRQGLSFHWAGVLQTAPFVQWLHANAEFEMVPLAGDDDATPMRLFRRRPRAE